MCARARILHGRFKSYNFPINNANETIKYSARCPIMLVVEGDGIDKREIMNRTVFSRSRDEPRVKLKNSPHRSTRDNTSVAKKR